MRMKLTVGLLVVCCVYANAEEYCQVKAGQECHSGDNWCCRDRKTHMTCVFSKSTNFPALWVSRTCEGFCGYDRRMHCHCCAELDRTGFVQCDDLVC